MLQASPKRATRHWRGLCLAIAVLGVVAVGLGQAGTFARQENRSLLQRITMVRHKMHTIVAAAVAKGANGEFTSNDTFIVNAYSEKGNSLSAMVFKATLKKGEEGKVEKAVLTLAATKGNGTALKTKIDDILKANAPPDARDLLTISQDGDSVTIELTPPKSDMQTVQSENNELDDSFKANKPEFHAKLAFGRSVPQMLTLLDKSAVLAPRGIEIQADVVMGSAVFDIAEDAAGGSPVSSPMKQYIDMMKVWKLMKTRDEMYYTSEDELGKFLDNLGAPKLKDLMKMACGMLPPSAVSNFKDIGNVLAGVQKFVIQALPEGWEMAASFDNFNPAPALAYCATK